MISEESLISINKKFSNGVLVDKESLDIALSSPEKPWMDQVAYLVKGLLVDHIFENGNKRTAAIIIAASYTEFEIGFNAQRIDEIVVEIESKDIADIDKIKEMIKSVIR
jgi:prophage maintenance system killer protein